MSYEKTIEGTTVYEGVIVNVRLDRAELVNGSIVNREVVEHPGGVTVLPVEEDGTVWCVRQFRYPFGREMLEAPAGKLEKGEDPLECAVRELSEETGLAEFLNVEKYKLSELEDKVMSGEIDDAKTIIAVLKARRYLEDRK